MSASRYIEPSAAAVNSRPVNGSSAGPGPGDFSRSTPHELSMALFAGDQNEN